MLPDNMKGKRWAAGDHEVTSDDLERVIEAIHNGVPRWHQFQGARNNTDRRVDKASTLLKRAGIIEFVGGKWRLVEKREVT